MKTVETQHQHVVSSDASSLVLLPHPHTVKQTGTNTQQGPCVFIHRLDVNRQMNNIVYQMALLFNTQAY